MGVAVLGTVGCRRKHATSPVQARHKLPWLIPAWPMLSWGGSFVFDRPRTKVHLILWGKERRKRDYAVALD